MVRLNRAKKSKFQGSTLVLCCVFASTLACNTSLAIEVVKAEQHADHQHSVMPTESKRSEVDYVLPQVTLISANRSKVSFPQAISDGRPVLLNFIYTTCTAVCPMVSQTFAAFQDKLGPEAARLHMVSISIDPEQDTPQRLTEYQKRYLAGPQWNFYTGMLDDSLKLQKAFNAYFGDKMNHQPVFFLRAAPGKPWVRLEGFITADDLLKEYRGFNTAG